MRTVDPIRRGLRRNIIKYNTSPVCYVRTVDPIRRGLRPLAGLRNDGVVFVRTVDPIRRGLRQIIFQD